MGKLIWWIYVQPLKNIILTMLVLPIVWTALHQFLQHKQRLWKAINTFTLIISLVTIIYLTLYHRGESEYDVILTPFHSFIEAQIQPELYRSMLMNVFLFEPLGLSLSGLIPKKWYSLAITVVVGMLFSIGIEAAQFYYGLGRCEVDDVIMNTLGAAIGTIPWVIVRYGVVEKVAILLKKIAGSIKK